MTQSDADQELQTPSGRKEAGCVTYLGTGLWVYKEPYLLTHRRQMNHLSFQLQEHC